MINALRTFQVRPSLPEPLHPLGRLATNLRWVWDHPTQELFRWADPTLWEETGGNPVALLGALSADRVGALATDSAFLSQLARVDEQLDAYLGAAPASAPDGGAMPAVGYFSPEFGITHAMQTYSGGLGILAGDHLKAASDLGLALVGVGLLYRHGYFHQHLDANGWQREHYPDLNPHTLPLRRLERDGRPAMVEVELAGATVACQIWKADVGRVPLLLLDTDVPANDSADRNVTDKLYGGDNEHRLRQEIVLGIGGVRALQLAIELGEVDVTPDLFHSNEGHAGFLQLERIRRLIQREGLSFDEAVESARAGVLFTTHTPVPAGIDKFSPDLMRRYFTDFAQACGVPFGRLLTVGQTLPGPDEPFNMAVMGLRLSARANGVSQLHGRVSREMFSVLWPDLPAAETPITSVTNGVHSLTWIGPEMTALFQRHLAPDWPDNPASWDRISRINDDALWRTRERARERMVSRVRRAVRQQALRRGERVSALDWTEEVLDPGVLTIGFARRFAEYKRGTLLLRQSERLRRLLQSTERPVQFVFSGKAHPRDDLGKDLIRQLVHFGADPDLRTRLVFVEDYDMDIARSLYAGVDVWLNTPRRPHEACGTSGQKAVLNGALHCSTLDGWWDEMYDGENGFAIGGTDDLGEIESQDAADAQSLFDTLEHLIAPMFYDRSEGPLPRRWLARVRHSLETLGPRVLAARMVREYAADLYLPLAVRAAELRTDDHARARRLAGWRRRIDDAWPHVRIMDVTADDSAIAMGSERRLWAAVDLGSLTPDDVRVELLHGAVDADGHIGDVRIQPMRRAEGDDGVARYEASFTCDVAGEYGFTVRVVPLHADLISAADTGRAVWPRADDVRYHHVLDG
ncbi:MAG TPA: alpha-glucan family phosphorylase [Euzebyales bacterium]|nr:alpha-glucan family phosphorylase [Euzebyales bacterium]